MKTSILLEIAAYKRKEVEENRSLYTEKLLERSIFFETNPVSLKKYLLRPDLSGIIAEFKRKSPSRGMINEFVNIESVSVGYMQSGASALSVLTDSRYFGGKSEDLTIARKLNYCPILKKDFIIDKYQVIEAKSIGADAVLLIAAILKKDELFNLAKQAKSLFMETIMEVHDKNELDKYNEYIDIIGVNNRNLNDFSVDIKTSLDLAEHIPQKVLKISESGISNPGTIINLRKSGYKGFLIGETFMKTTRPEKTCAEFIKRLIEFELKFEKQIMTTC